MLSSAIPFAFFWGAFNSIVINGPMAEELHEVIIISSLLGGGGGVNLPIMKSMHFDLKLTFYDDTTLI